MNNFKKLLQILTIFTIILVNVSCEDKIEKAPDPNSQLRLDAMKEIKVIEENLLTTYGVVDKNARIYRIPIKRAIELIAQEAE